MPKINLLNHLETRGVDVKSNPLFLGNKKIHISVNLLWDEGVIRTRYGFRYFPMGIVGKFQGASRYDPTKGLSVSTFSDTEPGLIFVVAGAVFYKADNHCETKRISTAVFCEKGDVNVFQAENYVILQNNLTDTYWWNGSEDIVKSPGMNEQDWNDPDMPEVQIEPVAPVAIVSPCGINAKINGACSYEILDTFFNNSGVSFKFKNIGTGPLTVTEAVINGGSLSNLTTYSNLSGTVILPIILNPEEIIYVYESNIFSGSATYIVRMTCNGSNLEAAGTIP